MAYLHRVSSRVLAGSLASLGGVALAISCNADPTPGGVSLVPHCGSDGGNATCMANYPGKPWCDLCVDAEVNRGCTSTVPVPQCSPGGAITTGAGTGGGDTSTGSSSEGGDTISLDDSTSAGATTTGGLGCDSEGFDDVCNDADPAAPYCAGGRCVSCVDAGGDAFCDELVAPDTPACDAAAGTCVACDAVARPVCGGITPVCGDAGACEACDEHVDCPDTACHLSPNDALSGACFDESDVVWVDNTAICPGLGTEISPSCSLDGTLGGLAAGSNTLIKVVATGMPVLERVDAAGDFTVAIVGTGGVPVLNGNPALPGGALVLSGGVLAYVHNMRMIDNPLSHGMSCTGAELWLTDSELRGNQGWGLFDTGPCNVTTRRATIHHNNLGGIRVLGGTLDMVNSTVAVNGNGSAGPGIELQFATLDVLYSTIAGNDGVAADSITCNSAMGAIRNSIIQGATPLSIELDCFGLEMNNNATDNSNFAVGSNVQVPAYNAIQFVSPATGDFRLAAPPLSPFGGIALWQEGDPVLDADGSPRPTDGSLGYAGIDEPG